MNFATYFFMMILLALSEFILSVIGYQTMEQFGSPGLQWSFISLQTEIFMLPSLAYIIKAMLSRSHELKVLA